MRFVIQLKDLLPPLQKVASAAETKQTMLILSNILIETTQNFLTLKATDLELELCSRIALDHDTTPGRVTVSAKKLMDICRTLPDTSEIECVVKDHKLVLKAGNSRFSLNTIPAEEFPSVDEEASDFEITLQERELRYLLETTYYAMAQQDVRYYLNGLYLSIEKGSVKTVATDAHRLALAYIEFSGIDNRHYEILIPRKGVLELMRLLTDTGDSITLSLNSNHLRVVGRKITFSTKLIDSRFPDYRRVIPEHGNKVIELLRDDFKDALTRASVLSNEKYRGVRLQLSENTLRVTANNPEQETAEDILPVSYQGEELVIGFNVTYLLDVLNHLKSDVVRLIFSDSASSILVETDDRKRVNVVMPMRL